MLVAQELNSEGINTLVKSLTVPTEDFRNTRNSFIEKLEENPQFDMINKALAG